MSMIVWLVTDGQGPLKANFTDGYVQEGRRGDATFHAWAFQTVPLGDDRGIWRAVATVEMQPIAAPGLHLTMSEAMRSAKDACEAWASRYGQ